MTCHGRTSILLDKSRGGNVPARPPVGRGDYYYLAFGVGVYGKFAVGLPRRWSRA